MSHSGQTGVYFESGGNRLLGTLFLAPDDTPKPTVILLHGVPGIEKNYDLALMFRARGWNSLIFHYRGCWGSGGRYTFKTLPDDTHTALAYLRSGVHPQIDARQIALVGHSMGGWAAILAACHDPGLLGVASIGGVCDPRTIRFTPHEIATEYEPWLPGTTDFAAQWEALDEAWTPTLHVTEVQAPLLVLHGAQDTVIPASQSQELAQNAQTRTNTSTELHIHPDANHSFTWHREWLGETLWAWLNKIGQVH